MPRSSAPSKTVPPPRRRRKVQVPPAHAETHAAPARHVTRDGLFMSSDHKRELILAHAAVRHARPKIGWGIGYYVGVTASCLVVFSGWWMTVGTHLTSGISPQQDAAYQIIERNTQNLQVQTAADSQAVQQQITPLIQAENTASHGSTSSASTSTTISTPTTSQ